MTDTPERLYAAFVDLLGEDGSKLTACVLAERCGISRNTFYYHFDSIEALAAGAAARWLDGDYPPAASLHGCLEPLLERCAARRREVLRLYRSHYAHALTDRAHTVLSGRLADFLRGRLGALSPDDAAAELRLCDHILTGFFCHWLANNMSYDMKTHTARLDRDFDALYPPSRRDA